MERLEILTKYESISSNLRILTNTNFTDYFFYKIKHTYQPDK